MNVKGWIVSRLADGRVEAANEAGNARFIFTESADGSWEGKCVSLNELNEAFARMGVKPDAKQLAKVSAKAGDALRLFLASEQGKETK